MRKASQFSLFFVAALLPAQLSFADDSARLLRVDHYVRVHSAVPAIAGQTSQIYVREVVQAGIALRGPAPDRVALFVHGAGTPAEVAFDVPFQDYSWMAYLAHAGFDAFSMDMTGYGRSTRPAPMNDPCNLSREQQAGFIPALIPAPCSPSYPHPLTTIASDWNDLGAVIDYLRSLRHVDKVSMVAWSLGGPRAAGYTARHPEQVSQLVLLAPAYNRAGSADPPAQLPADGTTMTTPVPRRVHRQLGASNRLRRSSGPGCQRFGVGSDDRIRSGGSHLGNWRAARSASHRLGLECGAWSRSRKHRR